MKEIDGWVKIKKYTDDDGRPVCGKCELKPFYEECRYQFPKTFGVPDPTCPIWYGESKREEEKQVVNMGHVTRFSDSSLYDEVCCNCGATDARGDDRLIKPCPHAQEK